MTITSLLDHILGILFLSTDIEMSWVATRSVVLAGASVEGIFPGRERPIHDLTYNGVSGSHPRISLYPSVPTGAKAVKGPAGVWATRTVNARPETGFKRTTPYFYGLPRLIRARAFPTAIETPPPFSLRGDNRNHFPTNQARSINFWLRAGVIRPCLARAGTEDSSAGMRGRAHEICTARGALLLNWHVTNSSTLIAGVALAAIQALVERVEILERQVRV